ncbi:Glycoside hydrolase, family 1 [Metarhizium album ARSEF 1941]|uniref:Glycoside hydrolase, family 1 n=1 Tax=Metarhizium album (strain ARSEF 1941) TaxID=1081103 RepID=A0A0B2X5H0_METAS|nr:Glycoside hydrolase, family 1 [Metarhizium album ARSEF 1941]KHO01629.1 Glycoside hydrolase, family 1 [Metarhizium album ARSEF 1941]
MAGTWQMQQKRSSASDFPPPSVIHNIDTKLVCQEKQNPNSPRPQEVHLTRSIQATSVADSSVAVPTWLKIQQWAARAHASEWGFATAAYQIEGPVAKDGRGISIWDTFCHLEPSRTKGASGDIACDHHHQYEEDFDLLSKYGAKAYRFSVSWSRTIPQGGRNDPLNEQGVSFYSRLIDSLVKGGITPCVTLYHWDLPQGLHDRHGGWLDVQESQLDFERYARSAGRHAPGRSGTNDLSEAGNSATEPWIAGEAQILSHVRAGIAYNKEFKPSQAGQIGISLTGDYYEPWDSTDSRDKEAAKRRIKLHIGWFANAIFLETDYPSCMRGQLGHRLPIVTEAEFGLLNEAEIDFYGMNYYTSQFGRHGEGHVPDTDYVGNLDELQHNKQGTPVGEKSAIHWLRSCPGLFRKHLTRIYSLYGKPICITENGCPCPGEDSMACKEAVDDAYRIKYFNSHLDSICKSIVDDGAVTKGFFAWAHLGEFSTISQDPVVHQPKNGLMDMAHVSASHSLITRP